MLTVAIIEDEPAIRKEITWMLEQQPDIHIAGSGAKVAEAVLLISETKPDVVLMDIQLADGTGFDVLDQLPQLPGNIIFVTAYSQFAIKAIKAGALDYLLKPVAQEELYEALERCRQKKEQSELLAQLSVSRQALERALPESIALHTVNNVHIIRVQDILYCKGNGPYTSFHMTGNSKLLVSKPLKHYEDLFPAPHFLRTHRSYLVNRQYIDKLCRSEFLVLKNKEEIPVSTRRKNYILGALVDG